MIAKHTGVRTFDLVAYVTTFLEGNINDWPAVIQDGLYAAMERKSKEVELPLTIVHSYCDVDIDEPEGSRKRFFVRVIASEIVAADDRLVNLAGTVH